MNIVTIEAPQTGRSRVYEYGARLDHECEHAFWAQARLARHLYNNIVACMRQVYDECQALTVAAAGPAAAELQARIDHESARFADAKLRNDEPAMKSAAEARRALRRELWPLLAEARKTIKAELADRYRAIGKASGCRTYQLRCEAVAQGLGWATANATLDAALQAWKMSMKQGKPPRFAVGADRTQDTLTLQFTEAGGLQADRLLSGAHRELVLDPPREAGRRKYGNFQFRLGPAGANVYATGTWQYDRPIPDGSRIGQARMIRRQIGKDHRYYLQLLVTLPEQAEALPESRKPLVAVHMGWSADLSGRRVAGITDDADPGFASLLQLPADIEADLERASAMQSQRDEARDQMLPALKDALRDAVLPQDVADEWAAIRRLPAQHVAIRRLHRFARMLREADALPEFMEAWRKADRMLWQSSAHIAKRARNRRRDFYRVTARRLSEQYDAILIESLDLREAAQKIDEDTGERSEFGAKARSGRFVASLYELESALKNAAAQRHTAILVMDGAKTAQTCSLCGGSLSEDQQDRQTLHCNGCGATHDRKLNGAAVAWQIAAPDVVRMTQEYWMHAAAEREAEQAKTSERKAKMAAGRSAARAARALS